jgi:hypothetical protein
MPKTDTSISRSKQQPLMPAKQQPRTNGHRQTDYRKPIKRKNSTGPRTERGKAPFKKKCHPSYPSNRSLMAVDFAISGSLVRPGRPRDPVLVHRAAALLHASFRPHLAMTPLRFANPSPPSGWIEDFHLQAVDHARHTTTERPPRGGLSEIRSCVLI